MVQSGLGTGQHVDSQQGTSVNKMIELFALELVLLVIAEAHPPTAQPLCGVLDGQMAGMMTNPQVG